MGRKQLERWARRLEDVDLLLVRSVVLQEVTRRHLATPDTHEEGGG